MKYTFLLYTALVIVIASCQDMAVHYYNMGIESLENGDTAQAVEHFRQSVQLRSDDPDARINLGCALYAQGQYEDALQEFKFALDYYPDDPQLHFNLGEAYSAMGYLQAARSEYEFALKLDVELCKHREIL
jgi:Flp pilus assembly protein TadD